MCSSVKHETRVWHWDKGTRHRLVIYFSIFHYNPKKKRWLIIWHRPVVVASCSFIWTNRSNDRLSSNRLGNWQPTKSRGCCFFFSILFFLFLIHLNFKHGEKLNAKGNPFGLIQYSFLLSLYFILTYACCIPFVQCRMSTPASLNLVGWLNGRCSTPMNSKVNFNYISFHSSEWIWFNKSDSEMKRRMNEQKILHAENNNQNRTKQRTAQWKWTEENCNDFKSNSFE